LRKLAGTERPTMTDDWYEAVDKDEGGPLYGNEVLKENNNAHHPGFLTGCNKPVHRLHIPLLRQAFGVLV
jgi:hypothetical protein